MYGHLLRINEGTMPKTVLTRNYKENVSEQDQFKMGTAG